MNNKRQTIWLVSMLSLMVVLSAYYLFSQDAGSVNNPQTDAVAADGSNSPQISVDEVQTGSDDSGNSGVVDTSDAGKGGAAAEQTTANVSGNDSDSAVLQQMQAQQNASSGDDYFASLENKLNDSYSQKVQQLMTIVTNTKNDNDAVNKAYTELDSMEDTHAKVTDMENQLATQYQNAVVEQAGNGWQVTVESQNLTSAQAVQIIDMVTKQLGASADQVSVKFVK